MGSDGAQAVKALTQAAQPAAQSVMDQAASNPLDFVTQGMGQAQARPWVVTGDDSYNPEANSVAVDASQLMINEYRNQAAAAQGGELDFAQMMNNYIDNWDNYLETAAAQRQAYVRNDPDEIAGLQASGDPLIDVIASWEYDPTPKYEPIV